MAPYKAGEVFDTVRFLCNDTDDQLFHDADLVPALKIAINDLRLEFEDNNIPFTNLTSAIITVPAGVTSIGDNNEAGSPALPDDLIEIVSLYERWSGTSGGYARVERVRYLPHNDVVTSYLGAWSWQGQVIKFIGSSSDTEVKIDYVGNSFNRIVDANTHIELFNSLPFLGFRTAALAAYYIGENKTRSDELNQEVARTIESIESIGIKAQQGMPVRRRPFLSGYKRGGSRSWR